MFIEQKQRSSFFAHGLAIVSDRPLADLQIAEKPLPEIVLTHSWAEEQEQFRPMFHLTSDACVVQIPGIGRYECDGGNSIHARIHKRNNSIPFLLTTPMAAALLRRGRLCLRASAVEWKGQGTVILGSGCCGKSTLAAALGLRGFRVLADELCTISFEDNEPLLHPATGAQRLWWDSFSLLELPSPPKGASVVQRYDWPMVDFKQTSVPLRQIIVLDCDPGASTLPRRPIQGFDRNIVILGHVYLPFDVKEDATRALRQVHQGLRGIGVYQLSRTRSTPLRELVERAAELAC